MEVLSHPLNTQDQQSKKEIVEKYREIQNMKQALLKKQQQLIDMEKRLKAKEEALNK